jgi:hypothetical protein
MDWTNSLDLVKSTQSNPKKWVGSDNWGEYGFEKGKIQIKNRVSGKIGPKQKNSLTQ